MLIKSIDIRFQGTSTSTPQLKCERTLEYVTLVRHVYGEVFQWRREGDWIIALGDGRSLVA